MRKTLIFILTLLLFCSLSNKLSSNEFSSYTVVIDPGHGGVMSYPVDIHGDRYDPIGKKYLSVFRQGAGARYINEHIVMYEIAYKASVLLSMTKTPEGYRKFTKLIEKFGGRPRSRAAINVHLSRGDSHDVARLEKLKDPNADFRIFDYPSAENGSIRAGRISRINALKPQLLVTLHCDDNPPPSHRGITSIVVPPYRVFQESLLYFSDRDRMLKNFMGTIYERNWFVELNNRSNFEWFMSDSSIYFSGYELKKDFTPDLNKFKGYRQNMVQWKYNDPPVWKFYAAHNSAPSPYAAEMKNVQTKGLFWDRERSKYETYRRDNGPEGIGGDNYYACMEITRSILLALDHYNIHDREFYPGNPYFSVWSVPLLVNAVSAYLEVGYLRNSQFRYVLSSRNDVIAEGVAVGIYALLAGIDYDTQFKYKPSGKVIDLEKYAMPGNTTYFDTVAQ